MRLINHNSDSFVTGTASGIPSLTYLLLSKLVVTVLLIQLIQFTIQNPIACFNELGINDYDGMYYCYNQVVFLTW
jgi:hypothetical protein